MAEYGNWSSASENIFAAWLDGMLTPEEDKAFMEQCAADQGLCEILDANDQVDDYYEDLVEEGCDLPDELSSNFDIPYIPESSGDGDDGDIFSYDEETEDYGDDDDTINDDGFTNNDYDDDNIFSDIS